MILPIQILIYYNKIIDKVRFNEYDECCHELLIKLLNSNELNVGGEIFLLSDEEIQLSSYLSNIFSKNWSDDRFLNMNPNKFRHIYEYLNDDVKELNKNCYDEFIYLGCEFKNVNNIKISDDFNTKHEQNSSFVIEQKTMFTSRPEITFIYNTFTNRRFTYIEHSMITLSSIINSEKIFDVIIPKNIDLFHNQYIEIDITDIQNRIKNIGNLKTVNFYHSFDYITVYEKQKKIHYCSGSAMNYYNRQFLDINFIDGNKIVIPYDFNVFSNVKSIHYNALKTKIMSFKIKFNNIFDYIIIEPLNITLSEYFSDIEIKPFESINFHIRTTLLDPVQLQKHKHGQNASYHSTSCSNIIFHYSHSFLYDIDNTKMTIKIAEKLLLHTIVFYVMNKNLYLDNDVIKHVKMVVKSDTFDISELNMSFDNTIINFSNKLLHFEYKNIFNENMPEKYLICPMSTYSSTQKQATPFVKITPDKNANIDIILDSKTIGCKLGVLCLYYNDLQNDPIVENRFENYIELLEDVDNIELSEDDSN